MPTLASRTFTDDETEVVRIITDLGEQLMAEVMQLPHSRERSVALTHLESCVMWANKTISVVGIGHRVD